MAADFVFENNFAATVNEISDTVAAALNEIGGEIVAQVARNSRVDTGQTKNSFRYEEHGSVMAQEERLYVGSDSENAIWEEYGTGEYAVNGDGRKGGWYIPAEKLSKRAKRKLKKVVFKGKKGGKGGKVYYFTKGKKPTKALTKAFEKKKKWAQKRLAEKLGEISDDN